MKVFEYKNYLLCKDIFTCSNCKFFEPYFLDDSYYCKNMPYKDLSAKKYFRLSDIEVCSKFIPRFVLSAFKFDS